MVNLYFEDARAVELLSRRTNIPCSQIVRQCVRETLRRFESGEFKLEVPKNRKISAGELKFVARKGGETVWTAE